ncbi:phosphotransferase-like protein [endosymbiont GvMRE of Glomus versiforme]|uniref:phosphotransferase-like protein n=1 Tax=endosymbiont GvMRE of Glomus versiforme TaxID=2039283 RepID=UPI000EE566DE|nr:hypothetical protein [endosymbiont GvMRE of Glomus versiforme]RHZ36435.1 Chloramphenicol phosphotransferase [endosymbiont GvMRE of Glomus versiforme]
MIIFLNGGSSVGKSSIAREIMRQSEIPFLYFSIDHLVNYWIDEKFVSVNTENPPELKKAWFFHIEEKDKKGNPVIKIKDGAKAKKLHKDIIKCWSNLAQKGYSLIIDEVIWKKEIFTFYQQEFSHVNSPFIMIKVKCDLEAALLREKVRGDRFIGLVRGTKEVEKNIPNYDLEIDTTSILPSENAKIILNFIKKTNFSKLKIELWK